MNTSRWLTVILVAHLALGLVYSWATPVFEAPDEGFHMAVVRWIALGNGLPVQRVGQASDWAQEGSQPPLYHALAAGLTFWVDTRDWAQVYVFNPFSEIGVPGTPHNANFYRHTPAQAFPYRGTVLAVHLARWFSLLLSLGTVWLTFHLARGLFPGHERVALLAAALAAFNPKALFIHASVNNDNLLMLLSTAALLGSLHLMQPRVERFYLKALGLGALLGLAALTKVSGLVTWPLAALAVGWGAWQARDARRFVLGGVLIAGVALALSGWWFWRNYSLYGELLGLDTMVAIAGPRQPAIGLLALARDEWRGFFLSYWSVFGVFTILPPEWVHTVFDGLTLWALAGGLAAAVRGRARPGPALALVLLFCLLTLAGVARWTQSTPASQGRLMFGAIAPLSGLMAAGLLWPLSGLPPLTWRPRDRGTPSASRLASPHSLRSGEQVHGVEPEAAAWGGLLAGLVGLAALMPVAYIAPRYAPPPRLTEADLPADLRGLQVSYQDQLEIVGYQVDQVPRRPGESLKVTLYWRALAPIPADYALALHVYGRDTTEIGKLDTWPGGGRLPTSTWEPGAIYADEYALHLSPVAEVPNQLRLELVVWNGFPSAVLPASLPSAEQVRSITFDVGRIVPRQAPRFSPGLPLGSRFEYDIELLGLDYSPQDPLYLVLYWRADSPVPADYTVLVHLVDAQGQLITTADSPPLGGDWPTSAWIPGQPFADIRLVPLPADLAPGWYGLKLGLYERASLTRLAAYAPDGTRWPDDTLRVDRLLEVK